MEPSRDPSQESPDSDKQNTEAPPTEAGQRRAAAPQEGRADIEQLRAQLAEAEEQILRSQAEVENVRKRMRREIEDERKYANLPLMRDLLPVVDNLERAVAACEQNSDAESLVEGVKMVSRMFSDVLQAHHCQHIQALGSEFDPNLHEAISQQPSQDHAEGEVTHVTQEGFTLHDRVIRPAQVIVAVAAQ